MMTRATKSSAKGRRVWRGICLCAIPLLACSEPSAPVEPAPALEEQQARSEEPIASRCVGLEEEGMPIVSVTRDGERLRVSSEAEGAVSYRRWSAVDVNDDQLDDYLLQEADLLDEEGTSPAGLLGGSHGECAEGTCAAHLLVSCDTGRWAVMLATRWSPAEPELPAVDVSLALRVARAVSREDESVLREYLPETLQLDEACSVCDDPEDVESKHLRRRAFLRWIHERHEDVRLDRCDPEDPPDCGELFVGYRFRECVDDCCTNQRLEANHSQYTLRELCFGEEDGRRVLTRLALSGG